LRGAKLAFALGKVPDAFEPLALDPILKLAGDVTRILADLEHRHHNRLDLDRDGGGRPGGGAGSEKQEKGDSSTHSRRLAVSAPVRSPHYHKAQRPPNMGRLRSSLFYGGLNIGKDIGLWLEASPSRMARSVRPALS